MKKVEYQVWTKYGFFPTVRSTLRAARAVAKKHNVARIKRVTTITETVKPYEVR